MILVSLLSAFPGPFSQRFQLKTSFSLSSLTNHNPMLPAIVTKMGRGVVVTVGQVGSKPWAGNEAQDDSSLRSCLAIRTHQIR